MGSKGYFCLSSYAFQSRLNVETGEIVLPDGWDLGVDGHFPRFLERFLVFDAKTREFGYLTGTTMAICMCTDLGLLPSLVTRLRA